MYDPEDFEEFSQEIIRPKLILPVKTYQDILYLSRKSEIEISGLGKIEAKDNKFTVTRSILTNQSSTAVYTEMSAEEVGRANFEMRETPGRINWFWHSHLDMDTFWSQTDYDTIFKLSRPGWFIATVFNNRGDIKTCIAFGKPVTMFFDDIETIIDYSQAVNKALDDEYSAKVKEEGGIGYNLRPLPVDAGYYEPTDTDFAMSTTPDIDIIDVGDLKAASIILPKKTIRRKKK